MMPIGVPRVPYRTPKEGGWQWVDIWNCLVRTTTNRTPVEWWKRLPIKRYESRDLVGHRTRMLVVPCLLARMGSKP